MLLMKTSTPSRCFLVSCCYVRYYFRIETMFDSTFNTSCSWEGLCLLYVICVCLRMVVSNTYCYVFLLCFSSSCMDWPFLIAPSVFSNVYLSGHIISILSICQSDIQVWCSLLDCIVLSLYINGRRRLVNGSPWHIKITEKENKGIALGKKIVKMELKMDDRFMSYDYVLLCLIITTWCKRLSSLEIVHIIYYKMRSARGCYRDYFHVAVW
jgi:hypothetical protein